MVKIYYYYGSNTKICIKKLNLGLEDIMEKNS
jgi:hypothetical protein